MTSIHALSRVWCCAVLCCAVSIHPHRRLLMTYNQVCLNEDFMDPGVIVIDNTDDPIALAGERAID